MFHEIFLTGDTHIPHDIHKLNSTNFPKGKELTKNDYVIVLGDFGLLWSNVPCASEKYWTNWLNDKPWTTLFVDGNHENHPRLNELPTEKMLGGTVGKVSDSIFHLRRGEIYEINHKTFFVMGGAYSVDKEWRQEGKSWWPEETPNYKETEHAIDNLDKHKFKVDYVLSHTSYAGAIDELLSSRRGPFTDWGRLKDPTVDFLTYVEEHTEFDEWYFGHMHPNGHWTSKNDKTTCLYEDIVQLH